MDELVQKLSNGDHPVRVARVESASDLRAQITRGYVQIKFTDTRGGTELGVRVETAATDLARADFANATGTVHLVGTLTLNYARCRAVADIDLATLGGTGHLVVIESD